MKHMSFALTTPQFRARTKDVTRRNGWVNAKPGEIVMAVEKGMGLKKGEKVVRLGPIEFVSVRREKLSAMKDEDCAREGFPEMTARQFKKMYCQHNGCTTRKRVTRIEFRYL